MILFFVRRFNDIDHITPVIYKLSSSTNKRISVLCLNPDIDINRDYRLIFLQKKCGVNVDYIYTSFTPTIRHKLVSYMLVNKKINSTFMRIFGNCFRVFLGITRSILSFESYENFINSTFGKSWYRDFLDFFSPQILVFDWIKRYQHNVGLLFDEAKKRKIPILFLPHGINLMTSEFHTDEEESQGFVNNYNSLFTDCDYFVVSNEIEKNQRANRGISQDKLIALGSPRFGREWSKINAKLIPRLKNTPFDSNKLNIVFMEHSNHYRGNSNEIEASISKIAGLDFVNLIIKAHTRSNRFFNNYSNVHLADEKLTSTQLCDMADAVIVTISSIAIEPLLQGKILIYPEYFHRNKTLWGDKEACLKVSNEKALIQALHDIRDNPDIIPYSQKNIDSFLKTAIYNNDFKFNTLAAYAELILSKSIKNE